MSSPGNYDNSANVPLWVAATVNLTPDSANAVSMFDNTTPDAFITGQTIGIFGVDDNEAITNNIGSGWVKRTTGSGGRAGRVTQEVLSTSTSMNLDAEDVVYKDTIITITTQPANGSAVPGAGNTITYSVVASGTGSAALNYYWQFNNGSVWANTATQALLFSNNTTAILTANAALNTTNTYKVRAIVNANGTGAAAAISSNATITIV
ncbi:hypothetical protein UFOVP1655_178 [uncultured Caudovirales phage]|uniref:Ig-like domain-containing protein n=1 Tax=uncultured Caudovirales phage TaxID=2100421 RepID=A0A6J5T4U8_9CAUD|nr:hypothetical protein UFOVP1655_178 [uncultured Caudovirales phage]